MSGQQQHVTRQGSPWWVNALLAAADQVEAGAQDLTVEDRAQVAEAARRIYTAALPPGTDPDDVRRQVEAFATAMFAGGSTAAVLARAAKLQGFAAVAAASVIAHAATIPPKPQP